MEAIEKLTLAKKMKTIRIALGITQLELATNMGRSHTTIEHYENNRIIVTNANYKAFKQTLDMEDVPLKDEEIAAFIKEVLYPWNNMLNTGNTKKAKELQPRISYCVKWSYDENLQILYDLFSIRFYYGIDKREECDKIIESLRKREPEFTDEQIYWYYRYLGCIEHTACRYKSALALYYKAEKIGKSLDLNDNTYYYNIGNCLVFMGYYSLAVECLEKIQLKGIELYGIWRGANIQKLLAVCYSKLGKTDKALVMLYDCLEYFLSLKQSNRIGIGAIYLDIGKVHHDAGNFEKALECFDIAYQYHDEKNEAYIAFLCKKALFLRINNRKDGVAECLDKCLPLVTKGTLWYEWINGIKHSLTLDNQPSVDYIEWTTIPKINEHGCYWLMMEFYAILSSFFEKESKYKLALEYRNRTFLTYKKLMEGDLSL